MPQDFDEVYQLKITLSAIEPDIWRRIQVPSSYTFWDLHVAIQDAMGWLDCHLHLYRMPDPRTGKGIEIGISDMELFEDDELAAPGWDLQISDFFYVTNARALYEYDFGDGWEHEITLEDILPRDEGLEYPRCVAGERSCPPEDVGGVPGYGDFLTIIADPDHEQHEELLEWVGGAFDPEAFDPKQVTFDDPAERWQNAFGTSEGSAAVDPGGTVGSVPFESLPGIAPPPFEHFSPAEMHALLYHPFDEAQSPMVLDTALDADRYREAAITESVRRYLEILHDSQPVKLTQRGFVPPKFVRQLWDAGVIVERGGWFHDHAPSKELDCDYLGLLRFLCDGAGLTKIRQGEFSLTRKGIPLISPDRAGELYSCLFRFYAEKLAWDSQDGYPGSWIIQAGFGYVLYLVQHHGAITRAVAFYADRFRQAFPPVMEDFSVESLFPPDRAYLNAFHIRVLDRFLKRFGLVTLSRDAPAIDTSEISVLPTPLLQAFVNWR
jgi:hypothetical protein